MTVITIEFTRRDWLRLLDILAHNKELDGAIRLFQKIEEHVR